MKSGSASIDRHALTQAPHWMQAIVWVMSTIDSGGTIRSRSGGSPSSSSHGVTRRILVQCDDSMSVTRSLTTGMLPIGSTVIGAGPPSVVSRCAACGASGLPDACSARFANSCASPIWVRQASVDWPLIFTPQEPQIAARHEQRTDSEPSSRSLACSRPSSTESVGSSSTSNSCQNGPRAPRPPRACSGGP